MSNQWQAFLERLWPSRNVSSHGGGRWAAMLQVAIAIAIAVAAGPDVVAAMEMTTLLEMLGASLFLTAFTAGAKLAAQSFWRAACNIALPAAQVYVIRSDAPVPAKAQALVYCAVNAAWWLAGVLVVCASARSVIHVGI